MAVDYGPDGIRCNAVALGSIITARLDDELRPTLDAVHALGRLGTAQEVAEVVASCSVPPRGISKVDGMLQASRSMLVMRMVDRRRSCSSRTTISCVARVRPRVMASQVAVTQPEVIERVWDALISIPTA